MSTTQGTPVTVHIPCDSFSVQVRVGYGEVLSPIEQTALRVIDAMEKDRDGHPGVTSADDLAELLGLGRRVTLDLLHDIWRKGYARIDFGSGGVVVTEEVHRRIAEDTLHLLPGAEMSDARGDLMIDRLTGLVMPRRGRRAPADPQLAMSPECDTTDLQRAPRADLVSALESDLRRRQTDSGRTFDDSGEGAGSGPPAPSGRDAGRPPRVLSFRLTAREFQPPAQRWWIPLDLLTHEDPDTGLVQITVVDRDYPTDRHQLAGERLTQLVADFPAGRFARNLRATAASRAVDPPPLDALLRRLAAHAEGAAGIPAGQRANRHLELCDEARAVSTALDSRIAAEIQVRTVPAEDHLAHAVDLVRQAKRQVVLACPSILDSVWNKLEPELGRALERQVQVVLLWGDKPGSGLSKPLSIALSTLARQHGQSLLLYPAASARLGASVVVSDDRAALVSNRAVLGHTTAHGLGVLLGNPGADSGSGSATVRRLLDWAASTVPEGRMSRRLCTSEADFGHPPATAHAQDLMLPEAPPDDEHAPPAALRAWGDAWRARVAGLTSSSSSRELPSVRCVEGGAHLDLLWRALRSAQHRLVIATDRSGLDAVDERFRSLLQSRLSNGVQITLAFGAPDPAAAAPRKRFESLRELARDHPGQLHFGPASGRILVCDDVVVLGSFDFLTDGSRGAAFGRHRRRAELGVELIGEQIAAEVAAAVGEPAEVRVSAPTATADHSAPYADPVVVNIRQRIVNRYLPGAAGAEIIRTELLLAPDPWAVLEDLADTADPAIVAATAARCLLDHRGDGPPARTQHWQQRLVQLRWEQGDFFGAAALRRSVADPGLRPRAALAAVGAALRSPGIGSALFEVVADTDPVPDEHAALLVVAAAELLRSGDGSAADVVADLTARLDHPWNSLGQAVHRCWEELYGQPAVPAVRSALAVDRRREDDDARWRRLEYALLMGAQLPVDIGVAVRMHRNLFGPGGVFTRLQSAAEHRDRAALDQLLAVELPVGHKDSRTQVGVLIDETWRAYAQPRAELLTGRPRDKYQTRLAEVLDAAREAAADPVEAGRAAHGFDRAGDAAAVRVLARTLAPLRGVLGEAVDALAAAERRLARTAFGDFDDVITLGGRGGTDD
ncbi:hypothetical protein EDD99_2939 [Streptomyces sp. 846.5]|nr:hypothetical protein [Streptomyces sp. 846.5]TDU04475.1 hypothetical protein EDD99_2939 [Streptomyces sp. 846.5]